MSENVLETLQHAIQDVIAPDVRELKVRLASLEKQIDVQLKAANEKTDARFGAVDDKLAAMNEKMDAQFRALNEKMDVQFKAIMAAIGESGHNPGCTPLGSGLHPASA